MHFAEGEGGVQCGNVVCFYVMGKEKNTPFGTFLNLIIHWIFTRVDDYRADVRFLGHLSPSLSTLPGQVRHTPLPIPPIVVPLII